MGRTRLDLVPFLRKGLEKNLYTTLFYVDKELGKGRVKLPRKGDRLTKADQQMLKDWDAIKGREYKYGSSYSTARQRFRQAIKKSIFLEEEIKKDTLDFRFLTAAEISENKRKQNNSFSEAALSPVESMSSGYVSGSGSEMEMDIESTQECKTSFILESIHHDHNFGYNSWINFPEKVDEEVPYNIFEDSETSVGLNTADEITFVEDNHNMNKQYAFPTHFEIETYLDEMNTLDENDPNFSKEEMYEMYVQKPLSGQAVDPKLHSTVDILASKSKRVTEDLSFEMGRSSPIDFMDSLNWPQNANAILPSEPDYSVQKNYEMVKIQEPPEAVPVKGSCRAWKCIQVIKIDVFIQLIFEEKVYEVNSPPSGENNFLDYGNLKAIVDREVKEDLENYRPFHCAMIGTGSYLTIYFKPKC